MTAPGYDSRAPNPVEGLMSPPPETTSGLELTDDLIAVLYLLEAPRLEWVKVKRPDDGLVADLVLLAKHDLALWRRRYPGTVYEAKLTEAGRKVLVESDTLE
jgi:hypothetical protein